MSHLVKRFVKEDCVPGQGQQTRAHRPSTNGEFGIGAVNKRWIDGTDSAARTGDAALALTAAAGVHDAAEFVQGEVEALVALDAVQ